MPLPDERPRASVANLIGRFEQQTKRQSLTASNGPRLSSVSPHNTGDSAREHREWPPKPPQNARNVEAPPVPPSASSAEPSPQIVTEPLPIAESPPEPTPAPELTPAPAPTAASPPPVKQALKTQRQSSIGASSKPTSIISRVHSSPVKVPKDHSKPPPTARSPPKQSALTAQPIKPQHTGQSTTSTTTRRSIAKPTVSTPARPKTPSRTSLSKPNTPSRPKTPSANAMRPKTPSNLFAPTAASLAKARNAAEARATPIKKATLSASATDRLSKPTAASMSKVRSPPIPSPAPVRSAAKPAATRGHAVLRGTTKTRGAIRLKPSIGTAAKAAAGTAAAATVGEIVTSGSEAEAEVEEVVHSEQEADEHKLVEEPVHEEDHIEPELHADVAEDVHAVSPSPEHESVGALEDQALPIDEDHEPAVPELEADTALESSNIEPMPTGSDKTAVEEDVAAPVPVSADRLDEVKPRPTADDDLVAMVNMLESKPATTFRGENTIGVAEEDVQEIPDED